MADPIRLDVLSPKGKQTIFASAGAAKLTELLRHEALPLNTRCGQRGLCDGCRLELLQGRLVNLRTGAIVEANGQPLEIQGCEHRLEGGGPVAIRIPPRSLLAHEPQVVTNFRINVPRAQDPLWQQVEVTCPAPRTAEPLADVIARAVAEQFDTAMPVRFDTAATRQLSRLTGRSSWFVTVEFRGDHWCITAVAEQPQPQPLGVAIDIGTTTVALMLVDLATGEVVSQAAGFNRQMHLGDDVLTRINLCSTDATMLHHLQESVVNQTIEPLLREALRVAEETSMQKAETKPVAAGSGRIVALAVAGNTTMQHLLAGVDPSSMGIAPFTPTFLDHRVIACRQLGLKIPATAGSEEDSGETPVHLLPSAAAYIGADLTAGVLATGLLYDAGPSLLIDVGTNGEIILKHQDRLLGCATAAGPAFEGAKLASGIRAGRGAIEAIDFRTDPFAVETRTIGATKPIGICGSAYVDFLARARQINLISRTGRFQADAIAGLADHLVKEDGYALALRLSSQQGGRGVIISETDIAALVQAKAAIGAGILTLLERAGLQPSELRTVYLAGGFGLHISVPNAIACGLLPGFRPEQVQVVGNTSLAGAYLSLLDRNALEEIARIGRRLEVIELNLDPGFEDRYIDQLQLEDC